MTCLQLKYISNNTDSILDFYFSKLNFWQRALLRALCHREVECLTLKCSFSEPPRWNDFIQFIKVLLTNTDYKTYSLILQRKKSYSTAIIIVTVLIVTFRIWDFDLTADVYMTSFYYYFFVESLFYVCSKHFRHDFRTQSNHPFMFRHRTKSI